jgi:hypothetical protein
MCSRGLEWDMNRMLPLLTIVLIAGCSAHHESAPTPPPAAASPSPAPPSTASPTASPLPAELGPCTDSDLTITSGDVESADTLRRVAVSFKNTSPQPCTLIGYPGADLVTAAGGVLVHVERRPAAAAHRLTLNPGDTANADVQGYAIDTASGDACPRVGTLVVTAPGALVSHTLDAALPICTATVSSVD